MRQHQDVPVPGQQPLLFQGVSQYPPQIIAGVDAADALRRKSLIRDHGPQNPMSRKPMCLLP